MALDPVLANYSVHDLIQEIGQRPEFWGVMIYANRPPFDRDPAPDDKLFVAARDGLSQLSVIRLLARAIENYSV